MEPLVDATAQEGARRVALSYLDQAAEAAARLHDEEAVEALHDFRVGLRRLRSCLRAYRPILGASVGKKLARRLKRMAAATNAGRDAEVQLAWVLRFEQDDPVRHKHGVRWLAERLRRDRDEAYAELRERLSAQFDKVGGELRARLSRYTVRHRVGEPSAGPRFSELAADVIEAHMDALRAELRQIRGVEDETVAHGARIHGKRLRYLIEPFRGEVEGARGLVQRLKRLQDLLGDIQDLHNLGATLGEALEESSLERARRLRALASTAGGDVIAELATDNEPGLLAMLTRIQKDRLAMFGVLLDDWLAPGGELDALSADLDGMLARMRRVEDVEIERKFLLLGLPEVCRAHEPLLLEQGYLPGKHLIERVRRKRVGDKETYARTVKVGRGIRRIEIEESCSAELFASLWPLTMGRRVRKRRYRIPEGELVWEIDEFLDRELWLAEVELPSEEREAPPPEWLRPYLVREVTDEPAYVNVNLAR